MKSAIYTGTVFHQRHKPNLHAFTYRLFLMYISLTELEAVLGMSRWWSKSRWAPARFKREDFHGDPGVPLEQAVRDTVSAALGVRPEGDICLLANLRYFGYNMNPLVTYYCFDRSGGLQAIVAEVNNTPWNERHSYVIPCTPGASTQSYRFEKTFTVSPFNPLNMTYAWRSSEPGESLSIRIDNYSERDCIHSAVLSLQRRAITTSSLNRVLVAYPFQTLKVISSIYWEALRLWLKRTPFLGKDKKLEDAGSNGTVVSDGAANDIRSQDIISKIGVELPGHEDHRL